MIFGYDKGYTRDANFQYFFSINPLVDKPTLAFSESSPFQGGAAGFARKRKT
jgi:hypothetical protein